MAEHKVEIKMSRFDNAPWGFRVHGGMDFGSPLTIQKVSKPTWVYLFFTRTSQVRTVSLANKKFAQHKYYTTFEDGY